jgi:hypothetical protein
LPRDRWWRSKHPEHAMPERPRRYRPYRASGLYRGVPTAPQQTQAADIRDRLIADHLGGAPSAAQDIVLGLLGAAAAKHADAWAYLRAMPKPWVNRRSNRSWELVHDLSKLERHCAKLIEVLVNPALERREPPAENLADYVTRMSEDEPPGDDGAPA